jgi:hypothetical protein
VHGRTCIEPDDEVQKTGDWDRLSPPTLTDISQIGHIGGRVEYDGTEIREKSTETMSKAEDKASMKELSAA